MNTLGYPLPMNDRIPEITEARNIELGLGLQVSQPPETIFFSPFVIFFKKIIELSAKHVLGILHS